MTDLAQIVALATPIATAIAGALHLGRSLAGGERASFRIMALAIYSTALSDAALAQIQAHARLAHGVA